MDSPEKKVSGCENCDEGTVESDQLSLVGCETCLDPFQKADDFL